MLVLSAEYPLRGPLHRISTYPKRAGMHVSSKLAVAGGALALCK